MELSPALVLGRIHTMVEPGDTVDWMIVEGGRIARTGRGSPPDALSPDCRRIDLDGQAVLPSFVDAHVHLLGTGLLDLDLDLGDAKDFEEVLELVSAEAREHRGSILRAHSFDPDALVGGRYPTMHELDAISRDVPVWVRRRDGHSSVVNRMAWELLSVREDTCGVDLDAAGLPTGVLRGEAHTLAARRVHELLSRDERVEGYRRASEQAIARGAGTVHSLVGAPDPNDREIELATEVADALPIETVIYAQTEEIDRVASLGLPRIGGCLLLDGSFGSRTAAVSAPYVGGGLGRLYYTDDRLTGFLRAAHSRGLQVAMHAIGDRAVGQFLRALNAACGSDARGSRHRIEHCELAGDQDIAAMRRLGVSVCVQPAFELYWGAPGGLYERRLGAERAARTNPWRSMLAAGVHLGGGSDSYVTPLDPLLGIHAAANRRDGAESLSVFDAVALFTKGARRLSFDEHRAGTLEAGKDASFVVLDQDPFEIDPGRIRGVGVAGLVMRGRALLGL